VVEAVIEPRHDLEVTGAEVALDQTHLADRPRPERRGAAPVPVRIPGPVSEPAGGERGDHVEVAVGGLDEARMAGDGAARDRDRAVPRVRMVAPEMDEVRALHGDHLEVAVVVLDERGRAERAVSEPGGTVPGPSRESVVSPPVGEAAARERRDRLEIAVNADALDETGWAACDASAGELIGRSPPRPDHAVDVDVASRRAPEVVPLAPQRRQLPGIEVVLDQDDAGDIVLAAHRRVGAVPGMSRRVVVAPEVPEPATDVSRHHLEIAALPHRALNQ
jgi:hypothetical protein